MSKSRLNSKHLSRVLARSPRPDSYKNTVIWRWLQFVIAGGDEIGEVVRTMRKRVDMCNQFAHKTHLCQYLRRCKIPEPVVQRVHQHLWNLYAQFRDAEKQNANFGPLQRGVTRNPWAEEPTVSELIEDGVTGDSRWLSR